MTDKIILSENETGAACLISADLIRSIQEVERWQVQRAGQKRKRRLLLCSPVVTEEGLLLDGDLSLQGIAVLWLASSKRRVWAMCFVSLHS